MALISLRNVGKWVNDGKKKRWLFRHVSISFPSKGFFAVSGPSGCGKSTFLALLSGLNKPSEGKIFAGKRDLTGLSTNEWSLYRQKVVGLVFQHYNLIDYLTVLDNVVLPSSFAGTAKKKAVRRAEALLKSVGLCGKEKQIAGSCSGGEKQRVAICRSLINDPCVLLCDEPTGALDEKSSENVMGILKEISKKRLVIIVSHNQKLIDRYVDFEWRMGEACPTLQVDRGKTNLSWRRGRAKSSWQGAFLKKNLRKHLLKNLICLATASLGIVSGLLSFGYFKGSEAAVSTQARNAVDYRTIRLQEENKVSVASSPLSLIETRRPSLSGCLDFLGGIQADIRLDFSYFFPEASVFSFGGENKDPVCLYPVLSFNDGSLWSEEESVPDSIEFCLVNKAFAERYQEIDIGSRIRVPYSYEADGQRWKTEAFYGDFEFEIAKIVEDFPFMSSPKIYYSYSALETYFKDFLLGDELSVYDFVMDAKDNSAYSAFSRFAFCANCEDADKLCALSSGKENGIIASSNVLAAVESFSLLSKGTSWSLLAFTLISLISVAVVMAMSNYSSFLDERKERAILSSLGAYRGEVNRIYYSETSLCGLASGILALFVCPLASCGGNALFESKFGLKGLIDIPLLSCLGVPFLVPLIVLAFSLLFNLLCCSLPLLRANAGNLNEELRDE